MQHPQILHLLSYKTKKNSKFSDLVKKKYFQSINKHSPKIYYDTLCHCLREKNTLTTTSFLHCPTFCSRCPYHVFQNPTHSHLLVPFIYFDLLAVNSRGTTETQGTKFQQCNKKPASSPSEMRMVRGNDPFTAIQQLHPSPNILSITPVSKSHMKKHEGRS